MITRPEDLDPESQAWIREQVDRAPELSDRQQARLRMIFQAEESDALDAQRRSVVQARLAALDSDAEAS